MKPNSKSKFIVITGGVVSGLGKGVLTASLGAMLKKNNKVVAIKCDGYLNTDPGTINPVEHGEVFVLDDGSEVDMDFGHYERLIGIRAKGSWNITMGKVYKQILDDERLGKYLGRTVQLIPHVTDEIKRRMYKIATEEAGDVVFIEIGGTVGDMENELFIEAVRQIRNEIGPARILFAHLSYLPIVEGSGEQKSKPTQASIKLLNQAGIYPEIIFCRCDRKLTTEIRKKISLHCNIEENKVISNMNVENMNLLIEHFAEQGVGAFMESRLDLERSGVKENELLYVCLASILFSRKKRIPNTLKILSDAIAEPANLEAHEKPQSLTWPLPPLRIAICGKYMKLRDSYASVREAILHASVHRMLARKSFLSPDIHYIEVSDFEKKDLAQNSCYNEAGIAEKLSGFHGVIIPSGFGSRGLGGKIQVIRYLREHKIPFLGICLGMQLGVIEFARNVCGIVKAGTTEVLSDDHALQVEDPVIHLLEEQNHVTELGGSMRLGRKRVLLKEESLAYSIYKNFGEIEQGSFVHERFRHRYEVNNAYIKKMEEAGLLFSGCTEDGSIVQLMELPSHPFFVACQYHPELLSTLEKPAPLFQAFIEASLNKAKNV